MVGQINQKEATYNAIISILKVNNINFENGMNVNEVLNTEIKKEIKNVLIEGFKGNKIIYTDKFANSKLNNSLELNKYCSGLISNWTKKDQRINGGIIHKTKNPGSKAGSGDEQVRELKKLLKLVTDPEAKAEVKKTLNARLVEIKALKKPIITINIDAIPDNLKHLIK